jgi:ferredoxin
VKIVVDSNRCQGHGRCYDLAPDVFGADDDGYVVLLLPEGEVPAGLEAHARRAVGNCPERALTITDG